VVGIPEWTMKPRTLGTVPDGQRLLTLEEAADKLQISPGTLKNWIAMKKIEHVKVGKFTRFTRAALDRYIERQTIAARTE
jgi:excisionase family DNA binding protein